MLGQRQDAPPCPAFITVSPGKPTQTRSKAVRTLCDVAMWIFICPLTYGHLASACAQRESPSFRTRTVSEEPPFGLINQMPCLRSSRASRRWFCSDYALLYSAAPGHISHVHPHKTNGPLLLFSLSTLNVRDNFTSFADVSFPVLSMDATSAPDTRVSAIRTTRSRVRQHWKHQRVSFSSQTNVKHLMRG